MWDVTDAFKARVVESHAICTRCEVFQDQTWIADLEISDGQVTMDYNAERQRRCQITLGDPTGSLTPRTLSDMLATAGNEIKLYRGVYLLDGSTEHVPLGVFNISDADVTDSGDGRTITIRGFDRSRKVSVNKFEAPYVVPEGITYSVAIQALIQNRYPKAQFSMDTTPFLTTQSVLDTDRDPWKAAMSLARDQGCDLFFDGNGIVKCRPTIDPATAAVQWDYAEGENATVLSVNKRWLDETLYNYIIVTGESADKQPVSAIASDRDPSSPTFIEGPHGRHVYTYNSSSISNAIQAQVVADSLLYSFLGSYETIRFNAVVNPAHEPGDVITLRRDAIGVNARYAIDKITIPMVAIRAMECTLRQR